MDRVWAWWVARPRWQRWCGGFLVLAVLVLWVAVRALWRRPEPIPVTPAGTAAVAAADAAAAAAASRVDQSRAALDQRQQQRDKEAQHVQDELQERAADRAAAHRAISAAGDDVDRINAVLYGRRKGPG